MAGGTERRGSVCCGCLIHKTKEEEASFHKVLTTLLFCTRTGKFPLDESLKGIRSYLKGKIAFGCK